MIRGARLALALAALLAARTASAGPPPRGVPGVRPFGPGTDVEVGTTRAIQIYVARLPADGTPPSDYDFVKVGGAPISFQLPPGHYVLTMEDDGVTSRDQDLVVGTTPVHLQVHTGSSDMATLGSLALGIGTLCVLTAAVLAISGSKAPSSLDKTKIEIPLFAAGGTLVAGGIGLYFASRTNIEQNPPAPPQPPTRAYVAGVRVAF